MSKIIDDYLNEPELAREPQALREVHAIRLKIYDEIKNMTVAERTAYYHEGAAKFFGFDSANNSPTPPHPTSPRTQPAARPI